MYPSAALKTRGSFVRENKRHPSVWVVHHVEYSLYLAKANMPLARISLGAERRFRRESEGMAQESRKSRT